jgi:hypothetical protein
VRDPQQAGFNNNMTGNNSIKARAYHSIQPAIISVEEAKRGQDIGSCDSINTMDRTERVQQGQREPSVARFTASPLHVIPS